MLVIELHLKNALSPMLVTLEGIVMLVRFSQFLNAPTPMLVTLFGIDTVSSFWHPPNVQSEICVIPFGRVTLVKLSQSQKADTPI